MTSTSGSAIDCTIVDVFAETPLAGNQLAVFRGCGELDTATMQAIAREMNFSESTFVVDESAGEASVRIFTTDRELPFAGHPTLGTAWVLGRGRAEYTLQMAAGRVGVTFGPDGVAWMEPPPVALGESLDGSRAAALLGLSEDRIIIDIPSRYATVGPWFAMIGVSDLGALREIRVNRDVYDELSGGNYLYPFVFAPEGYSEDADFAARMLMVTEGGEDAATGSANTALAACLREVGREGRFIVEQGFEIGRPSRIYLDVGDAIRVGGKVRPVLTGEFRLPVGP